MKTATIPTDTISDVVNITKKLEFYGFLNLEYKTPDGFFEVVCEFEESREKDFLKVMKELEYESDMYTTE